LIMKSIEFFSKIQRNIQLSKKIDYFS